jgi:hypothetical protein
MATKIEQYNAAKREQTTCLAWTALIGNKYHGGGGGIGELKSLSLRSVTVYHQYSDGATNYHEIPAALAPHLLQSFVQRFDQGVVDQPVDHHHALAGRGINIDIAPGVGKTGLLDAGLGLSLGLGLRRDRDGQGEGEACERPSQNASVVQ